MKKLFKILFLICVIGNAIITYKIAFARAERTIYAKALYDCVFYKSSDLDYSIDNVYFIVPETYFVVVLEELSECYKVQYNRYVGYVEKNKIVIASFTPILKTLDGVTCDVKNSSGTQIWNKPSTSGGVLTTVSAGTKNIIYIASIYGSIPSGGESNLWYYISYTPEFNSTNVYEGYVYSENVTNMSEILTNAESNPEIVLDNNGDDNLFYLSTSMKSILIVIIAVPVILMFIIILYKMVNYFRKNTNKNKIIDEDSNVNYSNKYENYSFNKDYSLKKQINKLTDLSFVKKHKQRENYPTFPKFDSDDDLL